MHIISCMLLLTQQIFVTVAASFKGLRQLFLDISSNTQNNAQNDDLYNNALYSKYAKLCLYCFCSNTRWNTAETAVQNSAFVENEL